MLNIPRTTPRLAKRKLWPCGQQPTWWLPLTSTSAVASARDLLDLLVLMGHLECLEILDLKEKWELEETWDQGDPPVKTDFKGHLDFRASRAE